MASTDTHRDVTEIAKAVRQQIKTAVSIGALPDVTYRVRCARFSMGESISVTMLMDDERAWVPATEEEPEFYNYGMDKKLSEEVRAAGRYLGTIADVMGHNGKHFFVNVYLNGGICI